MWVFENMVSVICLAGMTFLLVMLLLVRLGVIPNIDGIYD